MNSYFGLEKRLVKVTQLYQMLGEIDADLMDAMGVDVIGLNPRTTIFGFENEDRKEFKTFWGQEVLVSKHFNTHVGQLRIL